MQIQDLDFDFPDELIAKTPVSNTRVMWVNANADLPSEISMDELIERFSCGDALVINNSLVLRRRVFTNSGLEVLFIKELKDNQWEVLFPASRVKNNQLVELPGRVSMRLVSRGRPQIISVSSKVDDAYFNSYGELPLPPYIQKARGERHNSTDDKNWYQTEWAEVAGSLAAPTASLHFKRDHLHKLKEKGVEIIPLTLHVGLGTFLPISTKNLDDHKMHFEECRVSSESWEKINSIKQKGGKIWALGTTVTRSLESCAAGVLEVDGHGHFSGATDLFIRPGFKFKIVDKLLTNFHQPKTTLLALVGAFSSSEKLRFSYQWAFKNKFRLFSYGDLTVW